MAGWSELMSGGTEHYLRGELADAVQLFREALAEADGLFAEDDDRYLLSLSMVATTLALTGEHDEAEALFRRQLTIREEAELAEDANLAECLEGLARCLHGRGETAEAEVVEARARAVRDGLAGAQDG